MRTAVVNRAGMKIGFIGIAEREWIDILHDLEHDVVYTNYKRSAAEFAKKLRSEQGCDYIIAVTHMRLKHDLVFAKEVPGVDLVLGGHDHDYHCSANHHQFKDPSLGQKVEGKVVPLVKSGTDF